MILKERARSQFPQVLRLHSIKARILVFALLATIIPSLTMGWVSYVQNKEILTEKISQELRDITSQAAREIDLWLRERFYELRVFSTSYVVSEDLEKVLRSDIVQVENAAALSRLKDYLQSVQEKFTDYEELMLVDLQGNMVTSSVDQPSEVSMPENWLEFAQADDRIIGDSLWDNSLQTTVQVIGQSIRTSHGRLLGALVARMNSGWRSNPANLSPQICRVSLRLSPVGR